DPALLQVPALDGGRKRLVPGIKVVVDVERAADALLEPAHRRLLRRHAPAVGAGAGAEEYALRRLGRRRGGRRRGRLDDRGLAPVVAPQGEGGTDDRQADDDGNGEAGAGGEEVPEPTGCSGRHGRRGLHGGNEQAEGTSRGPVLSVSRGRSTSTSEPALRPFHRPFVRDRRFVLGPRIHLTERAP